MITSLWLILSRKQLVLLSKQLSWGSISLVALCCTRFHILLSMKLCNDMIVAFLHDQLIFLPVPYSYLFMLNSHLNGLNRRGKSLCGVYTNNIFFCLSLHDQYTTAILLLLFHENLQGWHHPLYVLFKLLTPTNTFDSICLVPKEHTPTPPGTCILCALHHLSYV